MSHNTIQLLLFLLLLILLFIFIKDFVLEKNKIENFDTKTDWINENEKIIPKIIIQTWKTNNIPNNYKKDIDSLKKNNSEFEYKFFTDDDIDVFFKQYYPEYLVTYNRLPVNIQKFDFFRYVAIYHYGGFYFDLDITGLLPLDDLLIYECIFPIDEFLNSSMCKIKRYKYFCDNNMNFLLGQYAFAAKPKNDFIKFIIDRIHQQIDIYVKDYNSKNYSNYELYVYQTTGPDFVTKLYMEYQNKASIKILEYNKRQYFGKYARHNFYGSWKKNIRN